MKSKNALLLIEGKKDPSRDAIYRAVEKHLEIRFYSDFGQLDDLIQSSDKDHLLFLSPYALPTLAWMKSMITQLKSADIVGGDLEFSSGNPWEKTYAKLFRNRCKLSIGAKGFALPWASFQNLAMKRQVWHQVGLLSKAADLAAEKDWCWRAVLSGYKIEFNPVKVHAKRALSELQAVSEFFQRGESEAWLKRTYGFLTGETGFIIPLSAGLDAFRLLWKEGDSQLASLAFAYGSGMQWGYTQPLKPCPLKREQKITVSWNSGRNETTVLVPGKGLATLKGKMHKIYHLWEKGFSQEDLQKEFQRLFRLPVGQAKEELRELFSALTLH